MSYEWIVETVPVDRNFIILTFQKTDSYYKLYEFKLQAKNDVGHGPMSHVHTAHTGERSKYFLSFLSEACSMCLLSAL